MQTKTSKSKTSKLKPWKELTQEERVARVNQMRGKYAGLIGSTEEFLKQKQEDIDIEESRFERHRRKG
jgi:hypothetical protein